MDYRGQNTSASDGGNTNTRNIRSNSDANTDFNYLTAGTFNPQQDYHPWRHFPHPPTYGSQEQPYGTDPFYAHYPAHQYAPSSTNYSMPRPQVPNTFYNPISNQQFRSAFSHDSPTRQLPRLNRPIPESSGDDRYLAYFGDEFSSPSLAPLNSSPRAPTRLQSNFPRPLEVGEAMPIQARDQRASKTKAQSDTASRNSGSLTMPPAGRKRGPPDTRTAAIKRRRSSASSPASGDKTKSKRFSGVSPFLDDEPTSDPANEHAHETIDLSNAADVPDDLLANKCDNRVKIGKFQCVICMDDASHLTVTHCGHLFCSECLHSALHIDNMKKTCPVCRTKVDPKEKKGKNQKSYYHLELKIMTANKKGKQPANSS